MFATLSVPRSPLLAEESAIRIGKITVVRKNVFESGNKLDDLFPYSLANKIHVVTKESYVREEILFHEGDVYDPAVIAESERMLRRRSIFRYAKITTAPPVNGLADVVIETGDVWTTNLQAGYGLAGGKQTYQLGFQEQNFLGQGKSVGAFIKQDIDRFVKGVSYRDSHFLSRRWEMGGGFGADEKGHDFQLAAGKPFYSELGTDATGGTVNSSTDEDRQFKDGEDAARYRHSFESARLVQAWGINPSRVRVHRASVGYMARRDRFKDLTFQQPIEFTLPQNRTLSAPLVGYEYDKFNYLKHHGVITFDRDEDINLGLRFTMNAGPSLQALGATRDGAVFNQTGAKNFHPGEKHFFFFDDDVQGRYERGAFQNTQFQGTGRWVFQDYYQRNSLSLRANYVSGHNIDDGTQYLLGGDNGLRGYSVRQFGGNKKLLFILENRQLVVDDWLNLASVGWAAFFDTGAVAQAHQPIDIRDFKSDVGVGLRFALTRSVDKFVIRTDVAYALNDNLRKSPFVVNIGGEVQFGERRVPKFIP